MSDILELQTVSWAGVFLRVGLACFFGFLLGLDRSVKKKPVDFRVFMIVAATACLVALMGQELLASYHQENVRFFFDLTRVIEGVLVGIGFLGAGVIIKHGESEKVRGTATGASIWSAGAIGLMLGFGFYGLAGVGFIVLAVILVIFGFFRESLLHEEEKYEETS